MPTTLKRNPRTGVLPARVIRPRGMVGIKKYRYVNPERKRELERSILHLREHMLAELTRMAKNHDLTRDDREYFNRSRTSWKVLRGRIQRGTRMGTWIDLACKALFARRQYLYIVGGNNQKAVHQALAFTHKEGRDHSVFDTLDGSQRARYTKIREQIFIEHKWLETQRKRVEDLLYTFLEYREINKGSPLLDRSTKAIFKQLSPSLEKALGELPTKWL